MIIGNPNDNNSSNCENYVETGKFHTSTPKFIDCNECMNSSECADCIVKHIPGRHVRRRKYNFLILAIDHPLPITGRSRPYVEGDIS